MVLEGANVKMMAQLQGLVLQVSGYCNPHVFHKQLCLFLKDARRRGIWCCTSGRAVPLHLLESFEQDPCSQRLDFHRLLLFCRPPKSHQSLRGDAQGLWWSGNLRCSEGKREAGHRKWACRVISPQPSLRKYKTPVFPHEITPSIMYLCTEGCYSCCFIGYQHLSIIQKMKGIIRLSQKMQLSPKSLSAPPEANHFCVQMAFFSFSSPPSLQVRWVCGNWRVRSGRSHSMSLNIIQLLGRFTCILP